MAHAAGTSLGPYEIESRVGAGGMSVVYLESVLSLAIEIADALDAAHTAGIVHRARLQ